MKNKKSKRRTVKQKKIYPILEETNNDVDWYDDGYGMEDNFSEQSFIWSLILFVILITVFSPALILVLLGTSIYCLIRNLIRG
jgi:hypothetical protein